MESDDEVTCLGSSATGSGKKRSGPKEKPVMTHFKNLETKTSKVADRSCSGCGQRFPGLREQKALDHLRTCSKVSQLVKDRFAPQTGVARLLPAGGGKAAKRDSMGSFVDRVVAPDEAATIDKWLILHFVNDNVALRVVESPWFKRLLNALRPSYDTPGESLSCSQPFKQILQLYQT